MSKETPLQAQTFHDFAADIRQSASNGPTAIKDMVGTLIEARQQGGLFTGAEYAELRALLDHPDRWPFPSEFGAETALVGADVRLAVGHAIARFFLPLDDGTAKVLGMKPTDLGDNVVDPEAVLREAPSLLWGYWTLALQAVADRLDEEAKRIDAALTAVDGGRQTPAADPGSTAAGPVDPPAANPSGTTTDPPAVPEYLTSWREILIALEMKNNKENRQRVSRLNDTYDGPIIPGSQGKQPFVHKQKLLEWYRNLEVQLQDQLNQAKGKSADAESQHNWGRTGKAVPKIAGSVRQRRRDRNP